MAINPKSLKNLSTPKKGEVRNPKGRPKGSKNLASWIDELLNDPKFEANILDSKKGVVPYKGAPIKAIINAQIHLAVQGDTKAFDALAKHGYGVKQVVETNNPVAVIMQKFDLNGDDMDARQAPKA